MTAVGITYFEKPSRDKNIEKPSRDKNIDNCQQISVKFERTAVFILQTNYPSRRTKSA